MLMLGVSSENVLKQRFNLTNSKGDSQEVMTHTFSRIFLTLLSLVALAGAALAADPGLPYPASAEISDQKAGSVLVYNLYTSSATGGNTTNSRINITNTNSSYDIAVHLFFVDGNTCSVADSFICLTANQTASFLTSDVDPGVSGYIVAVASDEDGAPVNFNYLIGDEYVKIDGGFEANLGAEAVAAEAAYPYISLSGGALAALIFGSGAYNALPRVLADDNIPSRADGNETLLVVNRIGGANLAISGNAVGRLFGLLFDDAENAFSWTANVTVCQLRAVISSNFPRTVPRVETAISAGRSGWMKFYSTSATDLSSIGLPAATPASLLGAAINHNGDAGANANAFNGGHNLHKLTLNPIDAIIIPVFPPNC
ncbi:MAG: hypothetical protein JMDDDDMK_00701 [Acidobacteria bacterium]|nr:hypothetical protein [Acidobacteriota bacterium]